MSSDNKYLEQVQQQRVQLEDDLRNRRQMKMAPPMGATTPAEAEHNRGAGVARSSGPEGAAPGAAVEVRVTGWMFKNVVVPPNAYVVHTRKGHPEPLHCGLGISFPYNPDTDSFIVAPAAMQTIVIQANSITREKQGVLVQGYVQWIIEDFRTAYRKLDFTDTQDPMRLVNVQLREQAEAAIKDKVATMSIDDVLTDKQPIIKELTARLKHVAEGDGTDKGLGLRIVTVQIKEAVVSSPRVWEMLQRPFRAERAKEARLAELTHEAVIQEREAEAQKARESKRIQTEAEIARMQAEAEAAAFERTQGEQARRAKVEAESLKASIEHEKERLRLQSELSKAKAEAEGAEQEVRHLAWQRQAEREIAVEAQRRRVDNDLSPAALQAKVVDALPGILEKVPAPGEQKTIAIGGDLVGSLVGGVLRLVDAAKK